MGRTVPKTWCATAPPCHGVLELCSVFPVFCHSNSTHTRGIGADCRALSVRSAWDAARGLAPPRAPQPSDRCAWGAPPLVVGATRQPATLCVGSRTQPPGAPPGAPRARLAAVCGKGACVRSPASQLDMSWRNAFHCRLNVEDSFLRRRLLIVLWMAAALTQVLF